ncbi:helix-turn-helix domain-containing protein, partial [Amycolatopsis lurida]|uniref:helix-turn-helix domain-containing protein n=1 Tax=Amycolatopsis lurida TaxID=31959 RepID=UPI00364A16E9
MTAVQADDPNAPRPVGRYEWESVLRRVTLPDDLKYAALLLGTYADPDGTRVRPGEPELAAAMGKSKATARRRVSALQEMGFVRLVSRGGGRGAAARASVYRLTLPSDLLDRFEVRPPSGGRPMTAVTPLNQGERSSTKNSAQPRVSGVE